MKTDVYSSQVIGWEDRLQNDCNVSSGVLDHTIPTPPIKFINVIWEAV